MPRCARWILHAAAPLATEALQCRVTHGAQHYEPALMLVMLMFTMLFQTMCIETHVRLDR